MDNEGKLFGKTKIFMVGDGIGKVKRVSYIKDKNGVHQNAEKKERQRQKKTEREREKKKERQRQRKTEREREKKKERQRQRKTEREREKKKERKRQRKTEREKEGGKEGGAERKREQRNQERNLYNAQMLGCLEDEWDPKRKPIIPGIEFLTERKTASAQM